MVGAGVQVPPGPSDGRHQEVGQSPLGRQDIEVGPGYTTRNAGVGYALTDHISLDLRYWDTAKDKFGGDALDDFVGAWRAYVERISWRPRAPGSRPSAPAWPN